MRPQSTNSALIPIVELVGHRVVTASRIFYELAEFVDESRGGLELGFEGGRTVNFDGGSDGETLVLKTRPWADPFEGRMTPENQQFVDSSGKWSRFDVSNRQGYAQYIGATLLDVEPNFLISGALTSLALVFDDASTLRVGVSADETIVEIWA